MNLLKKSRQSIYVGRLCNVKKQNKTGSHRSRVEFLHPKKLKSESQDRDDVFILSFLYIHHAQFVENPLVLQVSKDQRRNQSVFGPVRALRECTCTPALKQSKQKSVRQNPINEKCALCVNETSSCALMGNNCQRTMKWAERECARRQGVGRNSARLVPRDH